MINVDVPAGLSKHDLYRFISVRLEAIAASENDPLANLCNFMAFLYWTLGNVNWVGLYILREGELVLGPFAGKPACTRIAMGSGVCGTAAKSQKAQVVADVHSFPGHIACDGDSKSEIVIPLYVRDTLWGVLDIDSPIVERFNNEDLTEITRITKQIETLAEALK